MIDAEFIIHSWEFVKECHRLAGTDEERERANRTARAIYERAVIDYGYKWVLDNLPPLDREDIKL